MLITESQKLPLILEHTHTPRSEACDLVMIRQVCVGIMTSLFLEATRTAKNALRIVCVVFVSALDIYRLRLG